MKQISSMDLYFLTKELKILENQRIDSFYLENKTFYFKIYIKNQGNKFLTFNIGKYIYLGKEKEESSIPSSFISYLRKNLKNTYIKSINQIENERILKIEIVKRLEVGGEGLVGEKKNLPPTTNHQPPTSKKSFQTFFLFLELFAPGNIILTDSDLIIKNMLSRKKFKDRKIIVKEKYELPPKRELSIFNLKLKDFELELKKSDLLIVKFLAIKFGLGGKFSEEIIFRTKLNKDKLANKIDKKEITKLIKIIEEIKLLKINPYLVLGKEKEIINFIPFDFKSINNKKQNLSSSSNLQPPTSNLFFNDSIENYFSNLAKESGLDSKEKEFKIQLKKLENRLKKQELQKIKILEDSKKYNKIGNKIYENYSLVDELLTSINKSAKEKGWDYVFKRLEVGGERLGVVKKLDYKNNTIILEL